MLALGLSIDLGLFGGSEDFRPSGYIGSLGYDEFLSGGASGASGGLGELEVCARDGGIVAFACWDVDMLFNRRGVVLALDARALCAADTTACCAGLGEDERMGGHRAEEETFVGSASQNLDLEG
jgi:hypothetical protein